MPFDLPAPPLPDHPTDVAWPTDEWPTGDAPAGFSALLDEAFDPSHPMAETRAVVAVHRGRLVAERYGGTTDVWGADGDPVTAESTLISWSMAKSMLHAALGILVADGRLDPTAPVAAPGWDDARAAITIDQCLQMRDGLAFSEDYDPETGASDVIDMLFGSGQADVAAFARNRPLAHEPGTVFNYSSGTTNVLSRMLGDLLGGRDAVESFLRDRLFGPLGMRSATPRFDDAGTWVASSYVYATARDMARFGTLYLRDGCWDGERLLPEGWVDHARAPLSRDDETGQYYGHHWWLTGDEWGTFWCSGFEGQQINVVPALDLVLVRMGKTPLANKAHVRGWGDRAIAAFA